MPLRNHRVLSVPLLLGLTALAGLVGCADNDRPTEYGRQRPPVDELDPRDRGIQSKDVLIASDKIAQSLLSLPELNDSPRQWTLVVTGVEDKTTDRKFRNNDYNIFLERLRTNLAQQGRGRIRLIENRDRFYDIRNKELEGERDDFGQGDGSAAAAPQAVQPDFGLYATASDLPNRGTTYYYFSFSVTNLKTRELVFNDAYEVRVARSRP